MQTEYIEAISADGTRLRLDFLWLGDRFGQRITLISADGTAQPLLESLEGTAHDAWPPSPPLQSLAIETRPDGHSVALLLGMAGNAHWSASIEAAADKAALIFDIACRHSTDAGALGGRYRRLADSKDLISIRADSAIISQNERTLEFQPIAASTSAGTTRWRYEISSG